MGDVVTLGKHAGIGIITIDNPPVNAMSHAMRKGLLETLRAAEADTDIEAIVLACAGRTFIAGADIKEFSTGIEPPLHNDVINALELSPKPVVAAIHGTALGGGCETTLGCHYRVAKADARLGLPEVTLGIIPGAGGTQRLPRLIGVEPALEMITSGKPITALQAKQLGLVDEVVEGDLAEAALAFAQNIIEHAHPVRRTRDLGAGIAGTDAAVFEQARAMLAKKKAGYEAPQAAVEAVQAATQTDFEAGLAREQEIFLRCMMSPQSAALRYVFFAERQASKVDDLPKDTPTRDVRKVAVLGAGTMGSGIAMCFADAGARVLLLEAGQEQLDRGVGLIKKHYESSVKKGRIKPEDAQTRVGSITPVLEYEALSDVDLVVEAVFEDMDLKKEVFARLDSVCKPGAILASNTSTLDVDEIAASTKRPEDVIGLHFFSPAQIMRLLEIVRGAKTAPDVLATSLALAKKIRKVGVVVGVCDGFVGNRMLDPYIREAFFLLEEGALPQQVDAALQRFGMAMGPFAMGDLAGMDVLWRIRQRKAATRPAGERYSHIADRVCEMGRYGQKTGAGMYKYEPGDRSPHPDPVVEEVIMKASEEAGITRRTISDEEIVERCIYALVNEGAKILEEGIAQRASDIDTIYLNGYGFPAYRGGPMFYADQTGTDTVLARVRAFEADHGKLWTPAPLLVQVGEAGKRFQDV